LGTVTASLNPAPLSATLMALLQKVPDRAAPSAATPAEPAGETPNRGGKSGPATGGRGRFLDIEV
jgi:hypothetical protein